jgi:hypothetical protein
MGWVTIAEFERKHHLNGVWVLVAGGVPEVDQTVSAIRASDRVEPA